MLVRKIIHAVILIFGIFELSAARSGGAAAPPARILSLAPAATEILFDLGLGGRVVGVTEYCKWPPEALEKTNVGDMMRVNMETVVYLAPDLVVISSMNGSLGDRIEALGFPVTTVYQDDFPMILESMQRVGDACGIGTEARRRTDELERTVEEMTMDNAARSGARKPPRVLVIIGRDPGDREFRRAHIAGPKSFYNDLLERCGAVNVFTDETAYASVTREGLMRLNPDIVIELIADYGMSNVDSGELLSQWDAFADLPAAREKKTAVIRGDFAFRAGPRYPRILKAFGMAINGGVRIISEEEL
jgi:iron complex transport system substrate-binding protein